MKREIYLVLILLFFQFTGSAKTLYFSAQDSIPLADALAKIESTYHVRIFYKSEWINGIKTLLPGKLTRPVKDLDIILSGTGYTFYNYKEHYFVMYKGSVPGNIKNLSTNRANNNNSNILYRLDGRILSENEESPIIGATIFVQELDTGTITDINGFFRFRLPAGNYTLELKSVGYIQQNENIDLTDNTNKTFYLPTEVKQLNEVVIKGKAEDFNVSDNSMGITTLTSKALKQEPPFMGEVDVIRSLLMLPGVTSVGEAASGFNVRGGSADQNLVILDDAPVFNTSHVFGLFSAFNDDAIEDVTLMRAGIPARYGGRLSSVLDVRTISKQVNRFTGSGGIGLFASRATLEVPLFKDHLTLIAGGRISYSDYLLHLVRNPQVKNSSAFFYDGNIKLNYKISPKSHLQYSYYSSYDKFKLPTDTLYQWGTNNHSLSYNQLVGKKLNISATGVYSGYRYGLLSNDPTSAFTWDAGIDYKEIKIDNLYMPLESNRIEFGAGAEWYNYMPGNLQPGDSSSIIPIRIDNLYSRDIFGYLGDEFDLLPFISVMVGIRYTDYNLLGPAHVNQYEPGIPRSDETITGSVFFGKGKSVQNYEGWEPRFSVRFLLNNKSSIKFSYNRMYQYIQQITNTASVTPIDLWMPSGPYLKPQMADEASIGYFRNFRENTIETSIEFYYKKMENIIDYKDGADLFLNPNVENALLQGIGRAYGVELYARKDFGRMTGFVSYTYSRTLKKIEGPTPDVTVNEGKYYPANYDKPHDFKMTAIYQINRRWSVSGNYVFTSGRPATYPESKYEIDGITIANFGDRNQERIPDYNRLDLSITLHGNNKKNKFWDGSWTFSIYNVYARKNAYSVYFKPIPGTRLPQAYKYSILGTALPSITYNFRFL